jgi:hypothetical protein
VHVAMMMMGHAFIHVYYSSDKGEKKSTGEHAQTQMYVLKKQHIILFVLIETEKKRREKTAS